MESKNIMFDLIGKGNNFWFELSRKWNSFYWKETELVA